MDNPRTDSPHPEDVALTRRINAICGPVFDFLGIRQQFEIIYRFVDQLTEGGPDEKEHTAETHRRYPYRQVFITWSRSRLRLKTDEEIEAIGTHEVFHEILFGDFERSLEYAVSKLSLSEVESEGLKGEVQEWSEDVIDRMTHIMQRARPRGGWDVL